MKDIDFLLCAKHNTNLDIKKESNSRKQSRFMLNTATGTLIGKIMDGSQP
ncbi:hypothetical protein [Paenibacillus sp. FSL H3-0310]